MKTAHAVVMSDTHAGAIRGLLAPGCYEKTGKRDDEISEVPLNVAQKYLWNCYMHFLTTVPDRYVFLHGGDMTQGYADKMSSTLCINNMTYQKKAGVKTLIPAALRATEVFLLFGTKAHASWMQNLEIEIAEDLEDALNGKFGRKREEREFEQYVKDMRRRLGIKKRRGYVQVHAGSEFNIRILNKQINMVHSRSSVQDNISTPLEAEIRDGKVKYALGTVPNADLIIRGHIHPDSWHVWTRYNTHAFFCPCFKLGSDYGAIGLARRYRKIPVMGAVNVTLTDQPMPKGITIHPEIYNPPPEDVKVFEAKL